MVSRSGWAALSRGRCWTAAARALSCQFGSCRVTAGGAWARWGWLNRGPDARRVARIPQTLVPRWPAAVTRCRLQRSRLTVAGAQELARSAHLLDFGSARHSRWSACPSWRQGIALRQYTPAQSARVAPTRPFIAVRRSGALCYASKTVNAFAAQWAINAASPELAACVARGKARPAYKHRGAPRRGCHPAPKALVPTPSAVHRDRSSVGPSAVGLERS